MNEIAFRSLPTQNFNDSLHSFENTLVFIVKSYRVELVARNGKIGCKSLYVAVRENLRNITLCASRILKI